MGAQLIRDLEQALVGLEVGWQGGSRAFRAAVDAYAEFHWNHMRKEEQELLPLAERFLTAEDWREIDAAFAGNNDPIADLRERDFEKLFSRIVSLAPEPVGLGERWKKAAGV
jgi:hemerythrin-like domain-containing protein